MKFAWDSYADYLRSEQWAVVKRIAIKQARHCCAVCGASGRLEVHHRSYENVFSETLDDVIVLCQRCHATHHRKLGRLPVEEFWAAFVEVSIADAALTGSTLTMLGRVQPVRVERKCIFLVDPAYSAGDEYTESLMELGAALRAYVDDCTMFVGPPDSGNDFTVALPG